MKIELLHWLVFEVTARQSILNGVQLRGRTRKYATEKGINLLIENTEDLANAVRFAVLNDDDAKSVTEFIMNIATDIKVSSVQRGIANPVLSKLKVNLAERYAE